MHAAINADTEAATLKLCMLNFSSGSAWPVTLGIGIGVGAGYSNCRHQFFRHGSHRPPFGRPPWGGGRPWWPGYGKGGEFQQSPCHQETKVKKQFHHFIYYYFSFALVNVQMTTKMI